MIAFLLLFASFLSLALFGFLGAATSSPEARKALRSNIVISVGPAIYASLYGGYSFAIGAFEALKGSVSAFGGSAVSLVAFSSILYFSVCFLVAAFGGREVRFGYIKFFAFSVFMGVSFLYSISRVDVVVFGIQIPVIWLIACGFLYFVFVGACHAVFARMILILNLGGFFLSYAETGRIFFQDYFILLEFLPDLPGIPGMLVIIGSTALSAYDFGVERGWFPPWPW